MLPLEDWGRWLKLASLTAFHGENGVLNCPLGFIEKELRVNEISKICLPNVSFQNGNDRVTVTFVNWGKYQAKSESYERVIKWRERQNSVTVTNVTTPLPDKKKKKKEKKKRIEEEKKKNLKDVLLQHEQIFSEAYPGINLENETAKAQAWIDSNPKNKKSNLKRFLNNWFTRAQDNANRFPPREEKFL